jgi:flagellin
MEENMSQGLSIANNLLANNVQYNLTKNQESLKNTVTQLSSGLRINSAADDPSGLAIATNLQTQVDGFQQASQNVQDANNAAAVAEGALQTTTDILQRIRGLAVEAASDVNSPSDKNNLQAEVSQLLLEVNRISQNTNFNGQPLLDGSHSGFQAYVSASDTITSNAVLASAGAGGSAGNLVAGVSQTASFNTTTAGATDGTIELAVVNTGSTSTGTTVGVQVTFIDSATQTVSVIGGAGFTFAANATVTVDNLIITLGNVTSPDSGTTSYVKVSQAVAASTNANAPALNIQSGANEGDTVQIGIQATNAQTLRISNINLATTSANNPSIGAEDAIGQIDNALNILLGQRAQLGAVIVRLNEDANNNNVAAVNLQASESSIRDLNVGAATTQFTKLQVLTQVGTSVLAQSNANAQSVLGLFR